ncbi:MAG: prolyl-tRNA synthetase associated domain-containing protein [Maricaulaceae bacterium]|jgi:Ala-tRNA(Pro) deacylase
MTQPAQRPAVHPAIAALSPPAGRAELLSVLDALGIAHRTIDHPATFTVAESSAIKSDMPGGHTKNLFLADKAGRLALVSALAETSVPVNKLHRALADRMPGVQRFSFGKEEALWEALGVRPGSVTAFALINDPGARVTMVLDAALMAHETVNFHPLENTATTAVSSADLMAFIRATGREPAVLDFGSLT